MEEPNSWKEPIDSMEKGDHEIALNNNENWTIEPCDVEMFCWQAEVVENSSMKEQWDEHVEVERGMTDMKKIMRCKEEIKWYANQTRGSNQMEI